MQAHNLTYAERARFAYNAGNTELAELLEYIVELEAEQERLIEAGDDLLDLAYTVLPYIEDLNEIPDNGYKPTAILKLLKDINQRIKKAENNAANQQTEDYLD